ncbi:Mitochondrial outer membrane protein [Wickerhamomyces ciferrii]|uniref:Mitochondrial outer membrane protein n=1 Tax=Wickerhamomyces ciferrii (strain ATCC 14091 / BCRC 22168 / CBS 111 / JCM 3599 / NBRC 0793 / NRRL Y-1031 F-60-10) TaxID=1206466 RepID=K0KLR0_WICCF|nr:Mitochondrial outer membrane protein [Wickerhamomyces ciferrii]CCH43926.1 Mitochondrial outer membrane protein [Wickerhamomyces ciferrii]
MLRALGFKKQETITKDEATPLILKQAHDFELALQAMDFLLDDRTQEGLHLIENEPDCTIKVMAVGVIRFLEATLGFEAEVMKKAGESLTKAENLSSRDRSKHQRLKLTTSANFPPGTEYAVIYAEANLLNALIMLLSESMIESAKALYKLRKAYHTLDEVFTLIKEYEKKQKQQQRSLNNLPNQSTSTLNSNTSSIWADVPFSINPDLIKDPKLSNIADDVASMRSSRLNGAHIGNSPANDRLRSELGYSKEGLIDPDSSSSIKTKEIDESQSTIDEYIISGANLCFGILQLVLSLIPPAIGKVLSVVGFRGSREDGLRKIWKSVEGRNVHGCIGLLALLVFYDGPFQFTDADFDIPDVSSTHSPQHTRTSTVNSELTNLSLTKTKSERRMRSESNAYQGVGKPTLLHPGKKLEDALLYARALFPHSALWLLQESRMLASRGRLEEALNLMDSLDRKIEMKQVEALLVFDRAMILIFLHKYERAANDFMKLVEINSWSPGLYTYTAGSCYLELYRMCKLGLIKDPKELKREEEFRNKAEKLILKAPVSAKYGKTSKQMPFDKFLLRKISHFQHSAQKYNVDFIDAIGTSPVHELAYFWNGYNRMPEDHLLLAQQLLDYSVSEHAKIPEVENQSMLRNLLQSITLRRLGGIEEGVQLLDEKVLLNIIELDESNPREPYRFIRHAEDPWLYPTALYEKALFLWKEYGTDGLEEAKEWLKRAQAYSDDYELSTRVGMKIKAALDRLEGL